MTLQDAIHLIEYPDIAAKPAARWADLGCGTGLFTYALANLLQKGASIHAIDKSAVTLQKLSNPHHAAIAVRQLDFLHQPLPFENLDGILMANSLHFVANKAHFITTAGKYLGGETVFLIVEYDTDKANPWVPYPVSAQALKAVFAKAGYHSFTKLREIPSVYHTGNIYAALISP